jgi:hypothetical protein
MLPHMEEDIKWDEARSNAARTVQEQYLPLVFKSKSVPKMYVTLESEYLSWQEYLFN